MKKFSQEDAPWLFKKELQAVLDILSRDGESARVVGGAVRNGLIGAPISDIDIATTNLPHQTMKKAEAAGFGAVPTGIDFGTVTIVVNDYPFEVTTLRADVETDGRRAKVEFGRDWKRDAARRDFTINALYCDAGGEIYDEVGGLDDIKTRTLRFIGNAEDRICEDYLRILRFFRFFAWYGKGRPDSDGLKASAKLKDGLNRLSVERIWSELKKLLSAPDPSRSLLWMRQTGVLTTILPESEKWGIDAIHGLVDLEKNKGWLPDPMLRLEAIVPPDLSRMKTLAGRLKISNEEKKRLVKWADTAEILPQTSDFALKKALYLGNRQGIVDRLYLDLAGMRTKAIGDDQALLASGHLARLADVAQGWQSPVFPLSGQDLIAAGIAPGPAVGQKLRELENHWIDSGFKTGRNDLLKLITDKN